MKFCSLRKISLIALVVAVGLSVSGCSIKNTGAVGNSALTNMSDDSEFIVSKTTFKEAKQKLGGRVHHMFKKDDGNVKYVWTSRNTTWPSGKDTVKTIALTFDKNNVLLSKKFGLSPYEDPDVTKLKSDMLKRVVNGEFKQESKEAFAESEEQRTDPLQTFKTVGKMMSGSWK